MHRAKIGALVCLGFLLLGWAGIRWICDVLRGATIKTEGTDECLRAATSLLGMMVTVLLAFLVIINGEKDPSWFAAIAYCCVSALPWIGLVGICTARNACSGQLAFNPHERRIVWRFIVASSVLVLGTAIAYRTGELRIERWLGTGAAYYGMKFDATVEPGDVDWHFGLRGKAAKNWRLVDVLCFMHPERKEGDECLTFSTGTQTDINALGKLYPESAGTFYVLARLSQAIPGSPTPTKDEAFFETTPTK